MAHLTPTQYFLMASAASTSDLVVGLVTVLETEIVVLEVDVKVGQNQLSAR